MRYIGIIEMNLWNYIRREVITILMDSINAESSKGKNLDQVFDIKELCEIYDGFLFFVMRFVFIEKNKFQYERSLQN